MPLGAGLVVEAPGCKSEAVFGFRIVFHPPLDAGRLDRPRYLLEHLGRRVVIMLGQRKVDLALDLVGDEMGGVRLVSDEARAVDGGPGGHAIGKHAHRAIDVAAAHAIADTSRLALPRSRLSG